MNREGSNIIKDAIPYEEQGLFFNHLISSLKPMSIPMPREHDQKCAARVFQLSLLTQVQMLKVRIEMEVFYRTNLANPGPTLFIQDARPNQRLIGEKLKYSSNT